MKDFKQYFPGLLLLALFVAIGLFNFKDYGVAWDEPLAREIGLVYYNYEFKGDQKLVTYEEREHGSGFELPLIYLEKMLNISDNKRAVFQMRHLATHLFFLFSAFCGYLLFYSLFRRQSVACLGFMLLVLFPRIYAHSFFNSKDVPFLSMFLISLAVCRVAFTTNKTRWYILLGTVTGLACSIRITGILLPAAYSLMCGADIVSAFINKKRPLLLVKQFSLFLAFFCASLILFWPTLWSSPVHNFIECYGLMAHYGRWGGDVLFNGILYPGVKLPWLYAPEWFCITIPILWLLAGFTGIIWTWVSFIKKPLEGLQNTDLRFYLLCTALFILPVAMIIILHSLVYDDWRHLYFIYAPFVVLVLFTINKLSVGKMRWPMAAICLLQVSALSFFMIKNHPFQSVYMNEFVSRDKEYIRKHFEMEYWACGQKQAIDYILAHDHADKIKVAVSTQLDNNIITLPEHDRERILRVESPRDADYFVTSFRTHPDDYEYQNIFYNVTVLNSSILRVYKLH